MPETEQKSNGTIITLAFLLVVIGATTFQRGLMAPFIFDDLPNIVNNPHMRSLQPTLSKALGAVKEAPAYGRPVAAYSLALNFAFFELNPLSYHLFSLAVHLLNSLLVFDLIRRTIPRSQLGQRWVPRPGGTALLAFVFALVWLVHPIHTETVTYASQRTELMVSTFLLATLWAFTRGVASRRKGFWFGTAIFTCALGMATKELMGIAPLLVLLYDRTFVSGRFEQALRTHGRMYAGLALTWLLLAGLMAKFPRSDSTGFGHGEQTGLTAWTYLLTQSKVIVHYIQQVFWPTRLSIDIHFPTTQTIGQVVPQGLFLVTLLGLTIYALARRPFWGFVGAWFFIILAPTSSVIPVVTEIAAERRMYLPSLALVLAMFTLAYGVAWRTLRPMALVVIPGLTVAMMLAICSHIRLGNFVSEIALYEDAIKKFPENARAHRGLGTWYVEKGHLEKGIIHFERSIELDPKNMTPYHNLGVLYSRAREPEKALFYYRKYHAAIPDDLENLTDLANCRVVLANRSKKKNQLKETKRHLTNAEKHLKEVFKIDPDYAAAYASRARIHTSYGHHQRAELDLKTCLKIMRDNPVKVAGKLALRHNDLGAALAQQDRWDEAIEQWQLALKSDSNLQPARNNLAMALANRLNSQGIQLGQQGNYKEAIKVFRQAIELVPDHKPVQNNLEQAMSLINAKQSHTSTNKSSPTATPDTP